MRLREMRSQTQRCEHDAGIARIESHVDRAGFVIAALLAALAGRGVELRFVPTLWSLHDAEVSSTLQFSIIRMRNALPRPTGKVEP